MYTFLVSVGYTKTWQSENRLLGSLINWVDVNGSVSVQFDFTISPLFIVWCQYGGRIVSGMAWLFGLWTIAVRARRDSILMGVIVTRVDK